MVSISTMASSLILLLKLTSSHNSVRQLKITRFIMDILNIGNQCGIGRHFLRHCRQKKKLSQTLCYVCILECNTL